MPDRLTGAQIARAREVVLDLPLRRKLPLRHGAIATPDDVLDVLVAYGRVVEEELTRLTATKLEADRALIVLRSMRQDLANAASVLAEQDQREAAAMDAAREILERRVEADEHEHDWTFGGTCTATGCLARRTS
jgi:hypothetical protein